MKTRLWALLALLYLAGCSGGSGSAATADAEDPAQVTLGERLFLETRFAQFFAAKASDTNQPLAAGDPVMDTLPGADGNDRPGPFAGQSMNCRQCHLVDEALDGTGDGMRSYADFAQRSPIPARADRGSVTPTTPRNSPSLVNASLARPGALLFHFDGEFATLEDLVTATLTGRNYGWLADEQAAAIAHVARVVREDDGSGALAQEFGGSYRRIFAGTDPAMPAGLRLPAEFRLDVDKASDAQILAGVARLIAVYVRQLEFARDAAGIFNGSPYDLFLQINGLPRQPAAGEAPLDYARRLRAALDDGRKLRGVPAGTRAFAFHPGRDFAFGEGELAGLRLFLDESRGACIACHAPPDFSDFGLHNTGAAQEDYDTVHGAGAFAALKIPSLSERNADPAPFLPPTTQHPAQLGLFRAVPVAGEPRATDLGAWLVLANPDLPGVQAGLRATICSSLALASCGDDAALLDLSIALFKTPGLRDLGHSGPYLHTGREAKLTDVLRFYQRSAEAARAGTLRNPDPKLAAIRLQDSDIGPIAKFLRSLDEDYN